MTKSATPKNRRTLPGYTGPCAIAVLMAFDRVHFAIDQPALPGPAHLVKAACRSLKFETGYAEYNPRFTGKVELYQPSPHAFDMLQSASLGSTVAAMPTYAEVAVDFLFDTAEDTQEYAKWVREHLVIKGLQGDVEVVKATTYYNGVRHGKGDGVVGRTGKSRKPPRDAALYADRPSKLNLDVPNREHAVHLEIRFDGHPALRRVGLASVQDFSSFDHEKFWAANVKFLKMPKKRELGAAIGGAAGDAVSAAAMRKRANKFEEKCTIEGNLYMHLMAKNAKKIGVRLGEKLQQIPLSRVLQIGPQITD